MLTGCPLCRDINWMSPVQGHPVNCDGETQVAVGEMFDELEWPYLLRPRRPVLLASLSQDSLWSSVYWKRQVYNPCSQLKTTRSYKKVPNTADTRHTVMPWRIPFSPELFLIRIVCLLWPIPSLQRSLVHSLFKQKFSQKFFYFVKISKLPLPGIMLKY